MRTVTFAVTGLNQLRLINSLKGQSIEVSGIVRKSYKEMEITVARAHKQKVIEMLDSQGFQHSVVDEKSLGLALKAALPRLGLVIGVLVMIALSVYATTFLWKIEVSGNQRVDELTIVRTLKENGIGVGAKKNFSVDSVKDVLLMIDDISAVSVELKGTTLKIDIVESTVVSPPKQQGEIVSLYDAEITRIVVNSGSSKVKIGDRVKIGDLLIEGVEYDTAGNKLKDVVPQGSVFGKVNFTHSEVVSLSGSYQRTGKVHSQTIISFFGLQIGKIKPYEMCEAQTTTTRIGSFFPLYAITTKFYELQQLPDLDLEQVTQSVIDRAVNSLIIRAGGSAITTTATTAQIADKVYKINVHIEAEISVGGKRID